MGQQHATVCNCAGCTRTALRENDGAGTITDRAGGQGCNSGLRARSLKVSLARQTTLLLIAQRLPAANSLRVRGADYCFGVLQ